MLAVAPIAPVVYNERVNQAVTMQHVSHSELIAFRVSSDLAAQLSAAAEAEGSSKSEVIRRALAERIGGTMDEETPDPFELNAMAARGDLNAQRRLASIAFERGIAPGDDDPSILLHEALIYARLAAAHGDREDEGRLIAMLCAAAARCDREGFGAIVRDLEAEAVGRVAKLAEEGEPIAEANLIGIIEAVSPSVAAGAQSYARRLNLC